MPSKRSKQFVEHLCKICHPKEPAFHSINKGTPMAPNQLQAVKITNMKHQRTGSDR